MKYGYGGPKNVDRGAHTRTHTCENESAYDVIVDK